MLAILVPATDLANVNDGATPRVCNGAAEHFMGYRRRVSLAEKNVAEDIRNRIAFSPTEVPVGNFPGSLFQFDEQRRDGICYHGTAGKENAVPAYLSSMYSQRILKLGRIATFHFKEEQTFLRTEIVKIANLCVGFVPRCLDSILGLAGDHSDQLIRILTQHV